MSDFNLIKDFVFILIVEIIINLTYLDIVNTFLRLFGSISKNDIEGYLEPFTFFHYSKNSAKDNNYILLFYHGLSYSISVDYLIYNCRSNNSCNIEIWETMYAIYKASI